MDPEKEIEKKYSEAVAILKEVQTCYGKLKKVNDEDKLVCTPNHGSYQYFINGKYTSKKNISKIRALAQRDYYNVLLRELPRYIKRLEAAQKTLCVDVIDEIYDCMAESRKNVVTPIKITKEDFIKQWMSEDYAKYDRWDDVKSELYSNRNERVRSKSEKIIADELYKYGVPYKYEAPLTVLDGKLLKVLRPDFLALNKRTGKEYVIEHLGMMDKYSYYNNALIKLGLLEKNGYILGENLLLLHETMEDQINIPVLRIYIEDYLI